MLKPGDHVTAEWTWGGDRFQGGGVVERVNVKTVKVRLTEDAGAHFKPGFVVTTAPWHVWKRTEARVSADFLREQRIDRNMHVGHRVSDFSTLDDLVAHARREGATHVLHIDDEIHLYFKRRDGRYEKSEVWQKDGYWHTQGPGSRAVVGRPPSNAKPIAVVREAPMRASETRSAHNPPHRRRHR